MLDSSPWRATLRLLLATALTCAPAAAQSPGFADLGRGPGGSGPRASGEDLPADRLDALLRGLPGGSSSVENWFAKWRGEYLDVAARSGGSLDPVEGAEKVFSGIFGEPAWRADQNQEVVLKVLAALTPPQRNQPERQRLLESMLDALATYATDRSRVRGHARRPDGDRATTRRRLLERANRGIRVEDADELYRDFGISVWDYKAAAFALLQHAVPRRDEAEAGHEEALLAHPPETNEDGGEQAMIDVASRALEGARQAGNTARTRHVEKEVQRIRDQADLRQRAIERLRARLGDAALTSPQLLAAAYRQAVARDPSLRPVLRRALLDLGRAEAELVRISERLELPAVAELRQASEEVADERLFMGVDASSLGQKISKEVLDADIRLSAKLFDLDLAPGVSLSGKYTWELEDGNRKDSWNRIDEWTVKANLGAGAWIQEVFELPFSVGIDHERRILLVREFDTWGAAAKATPKTPLSLPLTAARARDLPMGWFWSLPVRLSAVASMVFGYTEGFVGAEAYGNYVLSGRFRLNFFKEAPDKVRVQLIGARERGPGMGAAVKLGFDIFGIRILDKALANLIDLRVLKLEQNWRSGVGMALDYVYDLDDAAARHAFEKAVRISLGFGGLLATHPLIQRGDMEERLLTDLRPTERLFLEDRERPVDERRVDRRFMASNVFRTRNRSFRIGPRLARYARNSRWVENELMLTESDGTKKGFDFPIYVHWKGWQLLFGLYKESLEVQAFSLMQRPEGGGEPEGPQPLALRATIRDRRASQGEVLDVRQGVIRQLGPHLAAGLGISAAPVPSGGSGYRAHLLTVLHPPATGRILDPAEVDDEDLLEAAVRTIQAERPPGAPRTPEVEAQAAALAAPLLLVREIPGDPGNSLQIEALVRLAELSEWRSRGLRFLIEALGVPPTAELVHVDVSWQGKGVQGFQARFGASGFDDLYLIVSEALSAVSDRDRP